MDRQAPLVVVRTFIYRREAEVAHSVLEASDVPSFISADDLGGVGVGMDLDEGVRLMVRPEDLERATEILDLPARRPAEERDPTKPPGPPAEE